MFKTILAFIKAHTIATAITTTVVVMAVVATPIIVENYKLDKNVKENLDMLVSSDYKVASDSSEIENNVILNDNEVKDEEKQIDTNKPLVFQIEEIEKDDGKEYVIVPSYDKDYSQWSNKEKRDYQANLEAIARLAEEDYNSVAQNEKQIMDNIQKEFDLIDASWSEAYPCVAGAVSYNSYTKQYKGQYWKDVSATTDEGGTHYHYDKEHFSDVSAEEFRTVIYPKMLQIYQKAKKLGAYDFPEEEQYRQNLEKVYHLSD